MKFVTLKQTFFYLKTKSLHSSKLEIMKWFLYRTFLRVIFDFERMNNRLKSSESKLIKSKMKDDALFIHTIGQLTNLYEIYSEERQETFQPKKFTLSPIILDVGAHVGIYTIKKAFQYPKGVIYSIEPEEKNLETLRNNIKINNLSNVVPIKFALFDKGGYVELSIDEFKSGQYSLLKRSKQYEKIKVIPLDDLINKLELTSVDLIKIDTEGAEYPILIGGIQTLKKFKPFLVIETHPWIDKDCDKKITKFLKNLDYSLKKVRNRGSTIFALSNHLTR